MAETLSLGSILYEAEVSGEQLISLEAPFKSLKVPVNRFHFPLAFKTLSHNQ